MVRQRRLSRLLLRLQTSASLADFLTAAWFSMTTALFVLVFQDALPSQPGQMGFFPWTRWLALGLALGGLMMMIRYRGHVYRETGTLVYVRASGQQSNSWHYQASRLQRRHRMSLRCVAPHIAFVPTDDQGTVDLIDECATISNSLNALVNTDHSDHDRIIAPSMDWPMALAIGYQLSPQPELRLLELGDPGAARGTHPLEVTWKPRWRLPETGSPGPRDLDRVLKTVPLQPVRGAGRGAAGRMGLVLAFTGDATEVDLPRVLAPFGVSWYHLTKPAGVYPDLGNLADLVYDANRLTILSEALPYEVARLKAEAGDQELVVAAWLPETLCLTLGWGLAQLSCPFFLGTQLITFHGPARTYIPLRVHPSQA